MITRLKNVVFDIDGVLANFNTPFAQLLSNLSGIPVENFTFTEWYWYRKTNIDPKLVRRAWDMVLDDPVPFWESLELIGEDETFREIKSLKEDGFHPVFITARNPVLRDVTRQWLQSRLDIPYPDLILSEKKGHACEAIDAFAFLDDKYENGINVLRVRGTQTLVALRDQPYNRSAPPDPYLYRLPGVREFCEFIRHKTQGRDSV